jgi:hypothetical protein
VSPNVIICVYYTMRKQFKKLLLTLLDSAGSSLGQDECLGNLFSCSSLLNINVILGTYNKIIYIYSTWFGCIPKSTYSIKARFCSGYNVILWFLVENVYPILLLITLKPQALHLTAKILSELLHGIWNCSENYTYAGWETASNDVVLL